MSSADVSCDYTTKYGNGLGEVKLESEDIPAYQPSLAALIASEVVSDIIDSALDIAISKTSKNPLDLDWEKSCQIDMKENFNFETGTIEESTLSPSIKQIIEGLNSISVNSNAINTNAEEPVRLDIEMKRLLNDMMSPPYPIVNYEMAPRKDGVGDQPLRSTMEEELLYLENRSEDILVDPEQTRIVEKKSRVTDLVMNSKQVLSELLMDESARKTLEEWEEANEEVIKVIDLECVQPGEVIFEDKLEVCKKSEKIKILPEDIPLPPDDGEPSRSGYDDGFEDEADQIIPLPNEDIMDIVDLSRDAFQEEERQIGSGNNEENHGGKGDEYCTIAKGGQSSSNVNETALIIDEVIKPAAVCEKKDGKKKKWNFGRLWGFIKKRPSKSKGDLDTCTTK